MYWQEFGWTLNHRLQLIFIFCLGWTFIIVHLFCFKLFVNIFASIIAEVFQIPKPSPVPIRWTHADETLKMPFVMTEIIKLKKKYIIDTLSFDLAMQDYYTFCNRVDNPNFSVEKSKAAFDALCDKFADIFRISATEADLKETANIFSSEQKEVIPRVGFETEITEMNLTFGLFRHFYLTTQIKHSHNLKFMKDDFWALIFELSTVGDFGFKENEKPDKRMRTKYPQLFNKTGNYYKLLRNYFLFEVEYGRIRELGFISVSWDNDTSFDTLIPKFCKAFKIMYQINYLMWRHDNKSVKL